MKVLATMTIALTALYPASLVLADESPKTTIIYAGTLLAVPGDAPASEQTIVIVDDKIQEVRDGYVAANAFDGEVTIVDLKDKFVLPGLMDMHVHFTRNDRRDARVRVPFPAQVKFRVSERMPFSAFQQHPE